MEKTKKENTNQSDSNYSGFNNSSHESNNNSDPFGTPSFKQNKQNNPNSLSNYVSEPQTQNNLKEEQAYQILSNSTLDLKVLCQSGQNEATVTFGEITYKPQENAPEQKIDFTDLKLIKPDDSDLKRNYDNFIKFLETVESEFKSGYKKQNEAIIHIKFKKDEDINDNYNINCEYFIIDKDKKEDNEFKDENFLNKNGIYEGLNYLIDELGGS
mgnify:CR=1 FL=1